MICFPSRRRGGSKDKDRKNDQQDKCGGEKCRYAEQGGTAGGCRDG
jgi:hypothetical protein